MLKNVLYMGGAALLPAGVINIVGRSSIGRPHASIGSNIEFGGKTMGTGYNITLAPHSTSTFNDATADSNAYITRSMGYEVMGYEVMGDKFMSDKLGDTQNANLHPSPYNNLQRDAYRVLQQIDSSMSTWRSQSELSQINRTADTDWREISASLFNVIESALYTSEMSGGAFDASVGRLVDLWGFGAGSRIVTNTVGQQPSVRKINSLLNEVGYQHVELNRQSSSIRKLNAAVTLDLSGIAKGYAVDELASFLDNQGLEHYLVEVGGELRSRGRKSDGSNWRVAIERPQSRYSEAYRIVELEDHAVATSGDYRHFFMHDNRRYSHSIDPRTGFPVDHALASVSVIAKTTLQADALSTALMIMGPDDAMGLAEEHNLAAQFIVRTKRAGLEEHMSQRFKDFLI